MGRCLRFLWRRGRGSLMITLGVLPVPILLTAYYARDFLPYVWLWPLIHVGLDVMGTVVRGKARILYAFFELAAMTGLTFLVGFPFENVQLCAPGVVYAALLLIELPLSAEERIAQPRILKYAVIGGLLHSVGQFFLTSERQVGKTVLKPVGPWLTVGFILLVAVALILLNEASLSSISQGRLQVGKVMRRKNLILTIAVGAVASAVAAVMVLIHRISHGLQAFYRRILEWISSLPSLLNRKRGSSNAPPPEETIPLGELETLEAEPSWVKTVITVVVIACAAAAVLYGLYFLIRKLKGFLELLGSGLQKYMQAVSEDFVDEITDTRDDRKKPEKRKKLSVFNMRKLSPAERIRYRYGLLMGKHPEWMTGSTARENLTASAAGVYERVRYSSHPVGEAEANIFDEETKRI